MWDFVYKILVSVFLMLDKVVYKLNVLLFETFYTIAKAKFPDDVFSNFASNFYVIIGIVVTFMVVFSLLQMLANPDLIADKEKGAGKLASRIVIAFGVIILVPTIFDYAYKIQGAIFKDNLIGMLILGQRGDSNGSDDIKTQGEVIAGTVFRSMILINEKAERKYNEIGQNNGAHNDMNKAWDCVNNILGENKPWFDQILYTDTGENCSTEKYQDEWVWDYQFVITTVVGAVVTWLVAGYCIDMGVRLFKLLALQLIAPLCVVTYISGGKNNAFSKWIKMTMSTFGSVFVKLATVYTFIFMAYTLTQKKDDLGLNGLGYVAVILGLLVFAKNAPNLIGDLFGIQPDKEGGLKGLAKAALIGGAGLALGAATGGLGSAISKFGASKQAGNGFWRSLGAGATGLFGGAVSGGFAGAKSKNPFQAGKTGIGIAQKKGQQTFNAGQTHWWDRAGAQMAGAVGMQTTAQSFDSKISGYDAITKSVGELDSYVAGEVAKDTTTRTSYSWTDTSGRTHLSRGNVNVLAQRIESLKANGGTAEQIADATTQYNVALKQAKIDFIDAHKSGSGNEDSTVVTKMSEINYTNVQNDLGLANVGTGAGVFDAKKSAITSSNNIKSSEKYRKAKEVEQAVKKNK